MSDTPAPKKSRRGSLPSWVVVLVLVLVIGTGACGYYVASQPKDGVRVEAVRAELVAKLPPGTPKDEIVKVFEAKGYKDYGKVTDTGGKTIGYRTLVPNDTYLEKAELDIACKFDEDGKVTTVEVQRIKVR